MLEKAPPPAAAGTTFSPLDDLVARAEQPGSTPFRRWPASLTGTCLCAGHPEVAGLCQVAVMGLPGGPETHWLPRLENATVRPGQTVMILTPAGADTPVVLGGLASSGETAWTSPSGYRVEAVAEGVAVRVLLPDGRTALEIDLREPTPTVRLLDDDVHLDLAGRLRVTARSIDLIARQGSATVTAHDDFRVEAERIRLN